MGAYGDGVKKATALQAGAHLAADVGTQQGEAHEDVALHEDTDRETALVALITAVAAGADAATADMIMAPAVPDMLSVDEGNKPFLVGHATGTQNYVCLPSDDDVKFKLFTPQATVFDGDGMEIGTHYFGPNPADDGAIRAAWQDSKDTSTIWGKLVHASADTEFVAPDAIAWLLVEVVGEAMGPSGGDTMMGATYIHRVNTGGGTAPATGCESSEDVGASAFVPYVADYVFYKAM